MGLIREDVKTFSELDAEVRIKLLIEYIKTLQAGYNTNSTKLLENVDVNAALKKAYAQLEKEISE